MKRTLAALFLLVFAAAIPGQELPRCPKAECAVPVTSSWWRFCPMCGTALPPFALAGPLADGERVLGNVYTHGRLGFRIEAPDDRWQILKGEAAGAVHPQAAMAMTHAPSLHAVVFCKDLPELPLEEFALQVAPGLDEREKVAEEERRIDGRRALDRTYRGRKRELVLVFRVLVAEDGPRRYQVAAWTTAEAWEAGGKDEVARIAESFRFLLPIR